MDVLRTTRSENSVGRRLRAYQNVAPRFRNKLSSTRRRVRDGFSGLIRGVGFEMTISTRCIKTNPDGGITSSADGEGGGKKSKANRRKLVCEWKTFYTICFVFPPRRSVFFSRRERKRNGGNNATPDAVLAQNRVHAVPSSGNRPPLSVRVRARSTWFAAASNKKSVVCNEQRQML